SRWGWWLNTSASAGKSSASTVVSVSATTEALAALLSTKAISPQMSPGESLAMGVPRRTSTTALPEARINRALGRELMVMMISRGLKTSRREIVFNRAQSLAVRYLSCIEFVNADTSTSLRIHDAGKAYSLLVRGCAGRFSHLLKRNPGISGLTALYHV